jgi:serine/threonine protein kinase
VEGSAREGLNRVSVASTPQELPQLPTDDLILVSVLGEGATAFVYRAWMTEHGQWCAVKVLKEGKPARTRQRFLDEALLLRGLSHRNLIKVFRVEDGAAPWFVMEIADGGSLKDWCARHGRMPPRLAVDAAIQVCKGVSIAHQAGYVHRDIKPHNVLVNRSGACKLTDFGVARIANRRVVDEDPSASGDALGTLGYMAPEQQADPSSVDEGADIYGIGALLFHLLIGDTPPGNLFMATREYPELFQSIPDALAPVLQKATNYKRSDRHATAMDLARDLHATWEFLPPLERSAPTLTTDIPHEPPPPPGMTTRTPNSAPSVDRVTLPPLDVFAPQVDENPALTPPSTSPSTPRPIVYRDEDEGASGTRWWLVGLMFVTLAFALFSVDVFWVGTARTECVAALTAFDEGARRNAAIIDELATMGADREVLAAAHTRLRSGSIRERHAAAVAFVELLSTAATTHSSDDRLAKVVNARLVELSAALASWTGSLERWEDRTDRLPGSLVSPLVGTPDKEVEGGR